MKTESSIGMSCFLALFLLSTQHLLAQDSPTAGKDAREFADRVRAITSSNKSEARLAAVTKSLDEMKVSYRLEAFKFQDAEGRDFAGKNLIVELGKVAGKKVSVGAHFDQVKVGQGAIDNASSCAVLLELIERFKAKPLKHIALDFVFFDLEEMGLIGSKAYAKALKEERPSYFVNVDIFGYGDTLWLMSPEHPKDSGKNGDAALRKAFKQAGVAAGFPVVFDDANQYPPGDHLSLMQAGIPTLGVALIDAGEIKPIKSLLAGKRVAPPPILRTIHTPDDNVAKIDEQESVLAMPILEAAIRALDDAS